MLLPSDELIAHCRRAIESQKPINQKTAREAIEYVLRAARQPHYRRLPAPTRDVTRVAEAPSKISPDPRLVEETFDRLSARQKKIFYHLSEACFHDRLPGADPKWVRTKDIRGVTKAERHGLARNLLDLEKLGLVKHLRQTSFTRGEKQFEWMITPLGVDVRRLILWSSKGRQHKGKPQL